MPTTVSGNSMKPLSASGPQFPYLNNKGFSSLEVWVPVIPETNSKTSDQICGEKICLCPQKTHGGGGEGRGEEGRESNAWYIHAGCLGNAGFLFLAFLLPYLASCCPGFDTVTTAISWSLMYLVTNPEKQRKIQEELGTWQRCIG